MLDGKRMQSCGGLPRHDLVMGGLATDDAAKRDAAAMAPCPADEAGGEREAQRKRDLERARYRDPLIFDAAALELHHGAAGELIGDVLVEARLDDQHRAR